jgi:outer membrane protein TolC
MTLEEAVEVALENNRELARAGLEVEGLAVARDEARARVRALTVAPAGRAEAGNGTVRREAGLEGSWTGPQGTVLGASAGGREWEFEGGEATRRGEVVLSVEQPLFRRFGRLAQEEPAVLADEGWRAARRSLERRKSQLAVDVAEAFEGVLWLEEQAASERASMGRLERLAAMSAVKERRGESTRSDTLRLEWQRGGAETRLETVLGQLEVRRRELADLLGWDGAELPVLEPPPLLKLETGDGDAAVDTALRERPEVAQAAADAASAARQEKLARRELLPDVRVAASQRFYGEGEEWSDAGDLDEDEWTVGVSARMNLARREARLAAEKAKTGVLAAEAALDAVKRRVALEARTALAEYRARTAECALAEENRARAEGRAELASALFEAGRGSADRVADAEADAVTSRLAAHEARREASVAAYRLLHALGTLVPAPEELLR